MQNALWPSHAGSYLGMYSTARVVVAVKLPEVAVTRP